MGDTVPAQATRLEQVARYGLPDSTDSPGLGPFEDEEFTDLLWECEEHRLLGLLAEAVRAGHAELTEDQHDRLEDLLEAWLTHALRVERLLLDAGAVLEGGGIDFRVLKGVALAHTTYPTPEWRVFGDLDLLVPGDRLTAATKLLAEALDATRAEPELRPGFDDRFGKEVMLRAPDRPELDLHRTFVSGAFGLTICLGDLFDPGEPFEIGGRQFSALPAPQRLLHAAYSTLLGDWPPRLGPARDLVQILLVHQPSDDEVLALARRWRAEAVLAGGLRQAWVDLDPGSAPPLVAWARGFVASRSERALVAAHVGAGRASTRHLAALAVVGGVSNRAGYLRAVAWPCRDYLDARELRRRDHIRRAVGRLR